MDNARTAFLKAIKSFPRWMDIRKRPQKAAGSKLLQSIMDEQDNIKAALDKFKSDFFLLSYVGREDEILDTVYVYQVGDVDAAAIKMLEPDIPVTDNPRTFIEDFDSYAIYQSGYIMLSPNAKGSLTTVRLTVNGYKYGGKLKKMPIWNIFDEFAMFLSLERFENETNRDLMHRCFAAFKNPTNSTEQGIKNAILNTVSNIVPVSDEDIRIETPSLENMYETDAEGEEIYEKLAAFNQDVFRTKKWSMDTWEHGFKQLDFLPHAWDAPIEVYQDGVGQMDDLKVSFSDDVENLETTDLEITGYKEDMVAVNSYVLSQNIKKEIPLKLEQFKNELRPKSVQYKIVASPVEKIPSPNKIRVRSMSKTTGEVEQYLEDIVTIPGNATIENSGALTGGHQYKLVFHAKTPYSDMNIDRINLVTGGKETSLVHETQNFKKVEGTLKNVDVALHVDEVNELKRSDHIVNHPKGMRLDAAETEGDLYVDVTGMGGQYIALGHRCDSEDITMNRALVKLKGFKETADGKLQDISTNTGNTVSIETEGYSVSFDYNNPTGLGSCTVLITVDGKIDTQNSGLWTTSRSYNAEYDHCSKVNIQITKAGMHPVEIANIRSKRYRVDVELQNAIGQTEFLETAYGRLLPMVEKNVENTLHIHLVNFGTKTPVIEYVHVGPSMEHVTYEVGSIAAQNGSALDIRSNCRVELYDTTGGGEKLISENYHTNKIYQNSTAEDLYLGIDTSGFISIQGASRKIENATMNGRSVKCIRLKPGEELGSMVITGTVYTLKGYDKLSALAGIADGEEVYVCQNADGLIVRNPSTKTERLLTIPRSKFASSAEIISFDGLPSSMTGIFVIDKTNSKTAAGSSFDHNFEYLYITTKNDTQYVAYNSATLFQSPLKHVAVVNTFSPILDITKLMYYEIEDVITATDSSTKVRFMKQTGEPQKWSLGLKDQGLQVETDMGYENSASYDADVSRLNEVFTLSNHIELPTSLSVNGVEAELGRYIITPPDDMELLYENEIVSQKDIIVEEDGFNKLWYSNITEINDVRQNGTSLLRGKYKLLVDNPDEGGKEGIILWQDKSFTGQKVDIIYTYKKPVALTYKSMMSLYELAGYNTNAYRKLNEAPIRMSELEDGAARPMDFGKASADKVIIRCSNANFQAIVEGNMVRVKRVSNENNALIKTGYYYDEGVEYYLFNHLHEEKIDRMSGVELFNVRRYGDTLILIRRSTNFLKDSAFAPSRKDPLCYIDCKENPRIEGLSQLQSVTACDAYNMWQGFNMQVELKQGVHNLGIHFEPENHTAYALMDISHIAKPNTVLSFAATDSLKTSILKEVLAGGQSMRKSTFAEKFAELKVEGAYRSIVFAEDIDTNVRYYLLVEGAGLIDDIVARPYDLALSTREVHKKNIEAIGFSIEEPLEKNTVLHLAFDTLGNVLSGLDITKAGTVITGSNVDWGLTKIYDVADDLEQCRITNVKRKRGAFYSEEKTGTVRTPDIFLENHEAVNSIFVKVNDVLLDCMQGFTIKVYGAMDKYSPYQLLTEETKTNIAQIFKPKLMPYLQIEVDMPVERVINTIEIYAEYAETESPLHIVPNDSGTLMTKVYDTAYAADYQLASVEGTLSHMENIDIYVRGCRRDTGHEVWTKWYKEPLDKNFRTETPHIFENYQLFQFKLVLKNSKAECSIQNFVLEVV